MIFINFKTYETGTGKKALDTIALLEEVSNQEGIKVIAVLQAADIKEATTTSKLEIWAQHTDAAPLGAHTGATLPEAVKEDGAVGTFLNHSEHRFESFALLSQANQRALSAGLKTLIFAATLDELKQVVDLKPTLVSYEPPELVGSQTTSVTQAKPEVIGDAVDVAKAAGLPLIVGAGIKSAADVKKSLELGAAGIAVASFVMKAPDVKAAALELMKGYES